MNFPAVKLPKTKLPAPPGLALIAAALLLATNIITGLVTCWAVRAHDFSETNTNIFLNWGGILGQFEDARDLKITEITHVPPSDETALYRIHEDNARFLVHYPKYCHRKGMDHNRSLTLFCWAVAADTYHSDNVDIQVDPAVWRAFLQDGPIDLPIYWDVRQSLTRAGAGQGLIRGEDTRHGLTPRLPLYKLGPLSTPYQPLPGEGTPS